MTTRLSGLIDRPVVDTSGRRLGRVFDIEAVITGGRPEVSVLLVGRRGFVERLVRSGGVPNGIPWERVVDVRADALVVEDGTRMPRSSEPA
ncbi:MAG: PRC-barrel domain-containing protein [Candidatus Dormibacteria bacterium]